MKKLLLFHIISLLLFVNQSTAQPFTSPLRFTNYTIAEGLPSNSVNDVMQDSRGFLWFSTAQGLARFDGSHFIIYGHSSKDSNSMPFDNIIKCAELNNHELLFLSNRKLWMLNPANGRQHPPPAFWQKKGLTDFFLLKENLMAIMIDAKTYLSDLSLDIIDSLNDPVRDVDKVIYLGNDNILFVNFYQAFAYSLANKKMEEWQIKHTPQNQKVLYYFHDVDTVNKHIYLRGGAYWAAEMSYDTAAPGYLRCTPIQHSFLSADNNIFYKNGVVIISGGQGLNILKPSQPEIIAQNILGNTNSILPSPQYHIYTDDTGNYWSTSEGGISRFSLQQLNYQFWKLPYPAIASHFAKYDNKIWMGDGRYGSYYLDCATQIFHIIDSSIIQYCWGAAPVNDQIYIHGNSTVATPRHPGIIKLLVFNPKTKKIATPFFLDPFTKGKELVTLVYQAHNGDVWYSINGGGGLVRQQPGKNKFTQYTESNTPSFHFRYVSKAAEDKNGNIYFSVNKKSDVLVWKNATQQFEEWKIDSLMPMKDTHFGPLWCHIIDRDQNLWLSYAQGGLVKYNLTTHNVKLYASEDGLPTNVFDNMVADADANIWIPSPRGLYCLLAATNKFIRFTERDGLPFTDFSNSNLFFDGAGPSLYFSSTSYLYKINSYTLLTHKKQSSVNLFIDGMDVNNHPYYFANNENIALQPDENNLQFSFTLLDLDNKISDKQYEYLLKRNNENANWQNLQGTNTIAFSRLKPGAYNLTIRMQNESGNGYINGGNIFHFTIATVWYNTPWFIFLCICIVAFIAWAFMRLYYQRRLAGQKAIIEKQNALEEERSRIAADMHDDVGAGLSRIRYIVSAIKEGKNISNADMDKIMGLSDESVEKMNEIIWSLNQGNRDLDELIYHIRSQCATMVSNADIEFICELPAAIPQINMGWNESRNIYMLVKEAVNNAVKHAVATIITVDFSFQNNFLITVTDNGKGYDAASANKEGNGLKNYQKRTAVLGGIFTIETSPGIGTKVMFRFMLPPQQHT